MKAYLKKSYVCLHFNLVNYAKSKFLNIVISIFPFNRWSKCNSNIFTKCAEIEYYDYAVCVSFYERGNFVKNDMKIYDVDLASYMFSWTGAHFPFSSAGSRKLQYVMTQIFVQS